MKPDSAASESENTAEARPATDGTDFDLHSGHFVRSMPSGFVWEACGVDCPSGEEFKAESDDSKLLVAMLTSWNGLQPTTTSKKLIDFEEAKKAEKQKLTDWAEGKLTGWVLRKKGSMERSLSTVSRELAEDPKKYETVCAAIDRLRGQLSCDHYICVPPTGNMRGDCMYFKPADGGMHYRPVDMPKSIPIKASPLSSITLNDESRLLSGIPAPAVFFCCSFPYEPLVQEPSYLKQKIKREGATEGEVKQLESDPFFKFLTIGGFIYFDIEYKIVHVSAISFTELEEGISPDLVNKVYCGRVSSLPSLAIRPLAQSERWETVSVPHIQSSFGFTHYSWIKPSEFLGDHVFPKNGGMHHAHRTPRRVTQPNTTRIELQDASRSRMCGREMTPFECCCGRLCIPQ